MCPACDPSVGCGLAEVVTVVHAVVACDGSPLLVVESHVRAWWILTVLIWLLCRVCVLLRGVCRVRVLVLR